MSAANPYGKLLPTEVTYLPVGDILPNPAQPRKNFPQDSLRELSESIALHGVLNPLTVRRRMGCLELVAGERRLRAAKMAGLSEVPCLILDINTEQSGILALIENLQRSDLDFLEQAQGIESLIRVFGMSQEEAAKRLGLSQSGVANKLRLLKLPEDVLERLRGEGLSERHGRALLRLSGAQSQRKALAEIVRRRLSVAQTDSYISSLLSDSPPEKTPAKPKRQFVLKDVRVFLNTLTHGVELMRSGGIDALVRQRETEDALVLTISIPKQRSGAQSVRQSKTK